MYFELITIPCLSDNYAFILYHTGNRSALLVDAPEAAPINETLTKNNLEDNNRFKRINVRKVASLKNLYEKPINNIEILIKDEKYLNQVLIKKLSRI